MAELEMESTIAQATRLARAFAPLRGAFRFALGTALPPLCAACRMPLGDGAALCAECWAKLHFIEPPYCARLGIPFTYDPGPGLLSTEAIANPPAYDRARAAVRYDDIARELVHRLKYGDRLDLAPMMGGWMARAGRELTADADALVPVPLHWRRLWARRFNQSAALAHAVSAIAGVPVLLETLKRVRATPQQVGLDKSERAVNVQGAFRVAPERKADVKGRRLILVDDVLTSAGGCRCCRCAGFCPGCRDRPRHHISAFRSLRKCRWSRSTPPVIARIAYKPRPCSNGKGSSSPRSTSGGIGSAGARWLTGRMVG
jgi:predicted amidophosphoribosyltransferase